MKAPKRKTTYAVVADGHGFMLDMPSVAECERYIACRSWDGIPLTEMDVAIYEAREVWTRVRRRKVRQ